MATFVINRRSVEDQVIYIEAETAAEAMEKARRDLADDTSDPERVSLTFRHMGTEDPALRSQSVHGRGE